MKRLAVAAVVLALAGPAAAAQVKAGDLTLSGLQLRAAPAGAPTTAAYLDIANAGAKPDKLLSVSCACAGRVEVHVSHVMNGMAMMMPSGPVEVPAHGSVAFSPGGRHLMLMGLTGALKDGSTAEVTLKFQRAGAVRAEFPVTARIERPEK